ncbi:MAG: hypothetical protein HRU74_10575 [Chthonomonadaceae bacterium]|nr:MAG: hypothetical protein HRU74_10575 [Chthonomonadaceae bacterium]
MHVPFLTASLPKIVDAEMFVFGNLGEWIKDHWKEWLGPLRLEDLHEADLFIVAHAPSDKPDILDAEHYDLMSKAGMLFSGLLLTDVKLGARPTHVKGSWSAPQN